MSRLNTWEWIISERFWTSRSARISASSISGAENGGTTWGRTAIPNSGTRRRSCTRRNSDDRRRQGLAGFPRTFQGLLLISSLLNQGLPLISSDLSEGSPWSPWGTSISRVECAWRTGKNERGPPQPPHCGGGGRLGNCYLFFF